MEATEPGSMPEREQAVGADPTAGEQLRRAKYMRAMKWIVLDGSAAIIGAGAGIWLLCSGATLRGILLLVLALGWFAPRTFLYAREARRLRAARRA